MEAVKELEASGNNGRIATNPEDRKDIYADAVEVWNQKYGNQIDWVDQDTLAPDALKDDIDAIDQDSLSPGHVLGGDTETQETP